MWSNRTPSNKLATTINAERTGTQMVSARAHLSSNLICENLNQTASLDPIDHTDRVATAYNSGVGVLHMKARQSNYWSKIT